MSQHDIHQYYFEKYLRHEMSQEDKLAFEEKLSVDESLAKAFEYYKANRQQFLDDLLSEQEDNNKQRKLNSWIYLLISVTGIVLAVNFYLDNKELRALRNETKNVERQEIPFYKRIPSLLFTDIDKPTTPYQTKGTITEQSPKSPFTEQNDILEDDELALSEEEDLDFNTDRLLHDTTLVAVNKQFYETRFNIIQAATDSLISDDFMEELAVKSALRNPAESKPQYYQVEFWLSPIHYRGYSFNGKKLVVFGIKPPFNIILFTENEDVILHTNGIEIVLTSDKEFHKF